jgi:DHA2 family multidrug resistance protein-like MFS transporter
MSMAAGGSRWWALTAMSIVLVATGLDLTILNVAIPTLSVDLGANNSQLQWFSNAYTLVMAALLMPAGRIGDRFGPRVPLISAVALFGLSSLGCAFADSPAALIVFRALLGASAGFFMPLSMAVLTRLFRGNDRTRAISVWTGAVGLGVPLGPVVGGWLLDHYWWGSVFLINVPLAALGVVALALLIPRLPGSRGLSLDLVGTLISSAGLLALTYGLVTTGNEGWNSVTAVIAVIGGVVLLGVLLLWLSRTRTPLFDLGLFTSRHFLWGSMMATVASLLMMSVIFVLPQFVNLAYATDALGVGLRLLPVIGGLVVGVPMTTVLLPRIGYRIVVTAGFLLISVACVLAMRTQLSQGYGYVLVWSCLIGLGLGFTLPPAMDLSLSPLGGEASGIGSALVQALRQTGGTLGVSLLGSLLMTSYSSAVNVSGLSTAEAGAVRNAPAIAATLARRTHRSGLLGSVQDAFLTGMHTFFGCSLAVALLASVITAWRMPKRLADEAGQLAPATHEDAQPELSAPQ